MQKLIPLIGLISLFSSPILNAENIKRSEVPYAVFEGLESEHPTARNISITRQKHFGLTLYEAQFLLHGIPHETLFDAKGIPFGHEEAVAKLPLAIRNQLKQEFSKFSIESAVSLHHPDGRVEYEIDLIRAGETWEIVSNPKGKILVKERI